jgi:hypothetical protein
LKLSANMEFPQTIWQQSGGMNTRTCGRRRLVRGRNDLSWIGHIPHLAGPFQNLGARERLMPLPLPISILAHERRNKLAAPFNI